MIDVIDSFSGRNAFMSNFSPHPVMIATIQFPTAEHAFQAMKTTDEEERQRFTLVASPGKAKRMGRKLTLRDDWEEIKVEVMEEVVENKFRQNLSLILPLVATRDRKLIEGNHWHDNFWGDCTCHQCRTIPGRNELGRILMDLRATFREERKS